MERKELENLHSEVLSTAEAVQKYEFIAFCAPFVEGAPPRRWLFGNIGVSAPPKVLFRIC